ncbi:MAG: hypothetical protein ACRDCT_07925 [Shewanella sp.]|uniref:FlxA-like protein n=1 Tax=Shewanella cutis TaxID=2766780 RepID=A0ABS9R0J0_9GAMM|nr:hypothetical protein [Shewanella sp. PS-2]
MNINGLNNIANSGAFKSVSSAYITTTPAINGSANQPAESNPQETVNISSKGRQALAIEVGASLREKAAEKRQQTESTENQEPKSIIDEQIDRIKEQIKALQEMLTKLAGDNSEAAAQQRKQLQEQIMQLNTQMVVLMDNKMRETQKAAG